MLPDTVLFIEKSYILRNIATKIAAILSDL
jgi:hypothetical protein